MVLICRAFARWHDA